MRPRPPREVHRRHRADGMRGAVGPSRHPALRAADAGLRRAHLVGQAVGIVPGERRDVVAVPGAVVSDPRHAAAARPLRRGAQIISAVLDGRGQLGRETEPERAAERLVAAAAARAVTHAQVERFGRQIAKPQDRRIALRAQLERTRVAGERQIARPALHRALQRIVQAKHSADILRVERRRLPAQVLRRAGEVERCVHCAEPVERR